MTFKEFLIEQKKSPWVAKKNDVIRLWNNTRPDSQIPIRPVPKGHVGNRFDQDGIRITGSSPFINSILGKLKPLLFYADHPSLDLDVKYRQAIRKSALDQPSFACYINVVNKSS
jgi:hypothetical protein